MKPKTGRPALTDDLFFKMLKQTAREFEFQKEETEKTIDLYYKKKAK